MNEDDATMVAEVQECPQQPEFVHWRPCDTTWMSTWNSCGCHVDALPPETTFSIEIPAGHRANCYLASGSSSDCRMLTNMVMIYFVIYCLWALKIPSLPFDRCLQEFDPDSCISTTNAGPSDTWKAVNTTKLQRFHMLESVNSIQNVILATFFINRQILRFCDHISTMAHLCSFNIAMHCVLICLIE